MDKLAVEMDLQQHGPDSGEIKPVITRIYHLPTEKGNIARTPVSQNSSAGVNPSFSFILDDTEVFQEVRRFLQQQKRTTRSDKRVLYYHLSLGYRMQERTGLIPTSKFNQMHKRLMVGAKLDPEEAEYFDEMSNYLLWDVVQNSDVIVCTACAAGQEDIRAAIRPTVVIVDEAAKATEAELCLY